MDRGLADRPQGETYWEGLRGAYPNQASEGGRPGCISSEQGRSQGQGLSAFGPPHAGTGLPLLLRASASGLTA